MLLVYVKDALESIIFLSQLKHKDLRVHHFLDDQNPHLFKIHTFWDMIAL
jgi:hypothetical protein